MSALIFVSFMAFSILFLIGFSLLMLKINKTRYTYLIKKKLDALGFTMISLNAIDQPNSFTQNDETGVELTGYAKSPFSFIYKQVIFKDTEQNEAACTVVIKKFLFFIIGIEYYFKN